MDMQTFAKHARNPGRTKDDLVTMMRNAIAGGHLECAQIARETLNIQFPDWDSPRSRRGGARPTRVKFRGPARIFLSEKEAYLWLVNRMVEAHPALLRARHWETEFVAEGKCQRYFATDPSDLFPRARHLADTYNHYDRLANGWYANLVMDQNRKWKTLCKLSAVAGFQYEVDWEWQVFP